MRVNVNPSDKPKRRYDASRRRAAADQNRDAVVQSARAQFLDRGYTATTMAAIAEDAGVALDTVYALVGAKPALFRLLIELAISGQRMPVPADDREYVQSIHSEHDPLTKIRIYAHAVTEIQSRLAPLFRVLQEAARSEPDLAALWTEIANRRATNMRRFVADVVGNDHTRTLPGDLTLDEAADLVWATNGSEFFLLLVDERGWPLERFERRLVEIWTNLLIGPI
jgi:AcrR family transcriptional regulator